MKFFMNGSFVSVPRDGSEWKSRGFRTDVIVAKSLSSSVFHDGFTHERTHTHIYLQRHL